MTQEFTDTDTFKRRLRDSLSRESAVSRLIRVAKHQNIYTCGDQDGMIYFIESGQVKLLMHSPKGKECLLAIYTAGDVFGELCLSGEGVRVETATAMERSVLKLIPASRFYAHIRNEELYEGFVQYLVARIAEQQESITQFMTASSERRLGKVLLLLARKLGKQDPRSVRIEQKISHEQLSEMVGTTRPRITEFMRRFLELGLIEISIEHFLIIKEQKLTDYLSESA
jgi:CRP-like cAMP-binding protein